MSRRNRPSPGNRSYIIIYILVKILALRGLNTRLGPAVLLHGPLIVPCAHSEGPGEGDGGVEGGGGYPDSCEPRVLWTVIVNRIQPSSSEL